MAMHVKSGGNLEIMGMLQGKVHLDTFIVIDVFALPVEGTETRVNAQAEAYEYIVDFAETGKVSCGLASCPAGWHVHDNPELDLYACRKWADLKTWWAGTTVILVMGVGSQASMLEHKLPSRCIKNLSWL